MSLFKVSPVTLAVGMNLPSIPNFAFGKFSKGYDISRVPNCCRLEFSLESSLSLMTFPLVSTSQH